MGRQKSKYLVRRGEIFYFRAAFPKALSNRLSRSEFKISLRTADMRKARLLALRLSYYWQLLLVNLAEMKKLAEPEINQLVRTYFQELLEDRTTVAELGPDSDAYDVDQEASFVPGFIEQKKKELNSATFSTATKFTAEKLSEQNGFLVPPASSDHMRLLCRGVIRAEIEANRIYLAMLSGEFEATKPKDPLFNSISDETTGTLSNANTDTITLGQAVEKYLSFKGGTWSPKTTYDQRRVTSWFVNAVGAHTPLRNIDKEKIRKFRDDLINIPKNYSKSPKYEGLSLNEVIELGRSESAIVIAPRTAKKYFEMAGAFINWAVAEGYMDGNPIGKINVPKPKASETEPRLFEDKDLESLFSSPLFAGCKSPSRRSKPGNLKIRDGKFWVPLIGLHTGMRLGEIISLRCQDFKVKNGVQVFDVNASKELGKTTKTVSSIRLVPVHPTLLQIGLKDYVREQGEKSGSTSRIFSDITIGKDGYASHNFGKFFSRYLKQIGMKTDGKVFHAFRHTFADGLRSNGVQEVHIGAMLGHVNNSMTSKYGSSVPLKILAESISMFDPAGLRETLIDVGVLPASGAQ